ncbi:MAG: ABC transporter ATP-binding protein [bacterium]
MLELNVTDLGKRYGPRVVFRGVGLRAVSGRVLVVTGPNGSGKSTLLRCLAGLERPDRGEVRWEEGQEVWTSEQCRTRMGFLSPELALYDELTGLENLRFFARMRGARPEGEGLDALLERVGLGGRGGDRIDGYSSGMRQRLKWAFALMHRPDALLLDEPGVTLDAEGFALAGELVAEAKERGAVVIIATNDTREMELGDEHYAIA